MDVSRSDKRSTAQRRKRIVIAAIAVASVAVVAALLLAGRDRSIDRASLTFGVVERGTFVREVRGPGRLVPRDARWAVARTDGTVDGLLLRAGAPVTETTPIIRLFNPDVDERALAATSELAAAKAEHASLVANLRGEVLDMQSSVVELESLLKSAEVDERANRLALQSGVIAKVNYDRSAILLQQLGRRTEFAQQRLREKRSAVDAVIDASASRLVQLDRARELRVVEQQALTVVAGMRGVVQQISVEEGQRVEAGANLARVADTDSFHAEIRVPESQSSDLEVGQAALVSVRGSKVPGEVTRINPLVEKGSTLVEVALTAALPGGSRADQTIEGTIVVDRIEGALYVQRPFGLGAGQRDKAFRVSGGHAESVTVKFGKESVNSIQVLSGLKEGDNIVLSNLGELTSRTSIRID